MTDEELDERVARLWSMLPIPAADLADAELLEAAALLTESGLVRVHGGVLTSVTLEEQLGEIFSWIVERHLRRVLTPTGEAAETDADVTE